MGLRFLLSAHRLIVFYISTNFHENLLNGIRVIERTKFQSEKFQGPKFRKNIGGVSAFILSTSSDGGSYLYQVS